MDISRDLKSHFSKFKQYITPGGIIFYDKRNYDTYMKIQQEVKETIKTFQQDACLFGGLKPPKSCLPSCDFVSDTLVLSV